MHLLLAWLAVQVARGQNVDASNQGSLTALSHLPLGKVLLGAIAVGMAALTLWQVIEAALGYQWLDDRKRLVRRIASGFRAAVYASLSWTAFKFLTSGRIASGESSSQQTTNTLFSLPGGRLLVALVGIGVAVAAIDQIQRGIRKSFVKYDLQGTPPLWAVRLGILGWVAKGGALAVVAGLFLTAAMHDSAKDAGGLDRALQTLRGWPAGQALLALVALGLACFGVFCFVWARYARHDAQEPEGGIR